MKQSQTSTRSYKLKYLQKKINFNVVYLQVFPIFNDTNFLHPIIFPHNHYILQNHHHNHHTSHETTTLVASLIQIRQNAQRRISLTAFLRCTFAARVQYVYRKIIAARPCRNLDVVNEKEREREQQEARKDVIHTHIHTNLSAVSCLLSFRRWRVR